MKPVIAPLLEVQQQLQVFHWQTKSYAEHNAFGRIYEAIGGLVDSYIEALFGRDERIVAKSDFVVTIKNYSPEAVTAFIDKTLSYLETDLPTVVNGKAATDLANIRDEMIAQFTTLKYLLTLK
jgi:hypothetical protein